MEPISINERRKHVAKVLGDRKGMSTKEYQAIADISGYAVTTIVGDVRYLLNQPTSCTIYGLRDPETNLIRYVGQTQCIPGDRLNQHVIRTQYGHEKNKMKAEWIGGLLAKGKRPALVVLEECGSKELNERERYWIKHFRSEGIELVNTTRTHVILTDQTDGTVYRLAR